MDNREAKRAEYIEKIKEFRLFDDSFLSRVFDENIECTELILRIILNDDNIKVEEVKTQFDIQNLKGRAVRLDIKGIMSDVKPFNVEVQRKTDGAGAKRARYNSSMLDVNTLVKSEDFEDLPENYVIFITEKDVFGKGLPIYEAERTIKQTGNLLGDGSYIIYVNGEYRDQDTAIGRLMSDFDCKNAEDMHYSQLAEQVRFYKETEKGVGIMCQIMEDVVNEEKIEIAKTFIQGKKLSLEDIAEGVKLPLDVVKRLAKEVNGKALV